jgi:hypothetical protein
MENRTKKENGTISDNYTALFNKNMSDYSEEEYHSAFMPVSCARHTDPLEI